MTEQSIRDPNDAGFSFQVLENVDPNDIVNLLCTAFDGPCVTYWANSADVILPEGFDVHKIPWLKDPDEWAKVRKCYIAPLVEGGAVILHDNEEEGKTYRLDLPAIVRGIEIMSTRFKQHWADFRNENDDAITGDVFVQCCVMGDVVFG